jgi:hypothetical protein
VIGNDDSADDYTFALTNLLLPNFSAGNGSTTAIHNGVTVTLTPEPDYSVRMEYLRAYKGIDVTSMMRLSAAASAEDVLAFAEDVCLILSVLSGHKVNWIARETVSALIFENRVTKPCSGWPVVGRLDQVLGRDWDWSALLKHALNGLSSFRQNADRYPLRKKIIDAWIDARIETDYLEMRCVKTVVVLEIISSAYRDHRLVKGTLRKLLEGVHLDLGISIPSNDLDDIIRLRNRIVHQGAFLLNSTRTKTEQYEMLNHYVDRLLLTLVGYSV